MLITPYDLLHPEGETARLELEVERRWGLFIDPALADVEIEVQGAGRARTGPAGRASVDLGVLAAGTYRYTVRGGSASAVAMVRVVPRNTSLFIADIDHTIADVSPIGFIFKRISRVRPVPDAPEVLQEIARTRQIVYLTARDHIFSGKTKAWLEMNRFPEGPLYLRKGSRFWTVSPKDQEIARLAELRSRFPGDAWGVGDMPGDVVAYQSASIHPILLSPVSPPGHPPAVPVLPTWPQIQALLKNP